MFLFELVLDRARRWIALQPELLDEMFPFFIGCELLERGTLLIGDDVDRFLIEPQVERRLCGLSLLLQSRRRLPRDQSHRGGCHEDYGGEQRCPSAVRTFRIQQTTDA